jgi:hypothetical protein
MAKLLVLLLASLVVAAGTRQEPDTGESAGPATTAPASLVSHGPATTPPASLVGHGLATTAPPGSNFSRGYRAGEGGTAPLLPSF